MVQRFQFLVERSRCNRRAASQFPLLDVRRGDRTHWNCFETRHSLVDADEPTPVRRGVQASLNRFKPSPNDFFESQISILQSMKSGSDFSQFRETATPQRLISRLERAL